jgi:hypothetical protein
MVEKWDAGLLLLIAITFCYKEYVCISEVIAVSGDAAKVRSG